MRILNTVFEAFDKHWNRLALVRIVVDSPCCLRLQPYRAETYVRFQGCTFALSNEGVLRKSSPAHPYIYANASSEIESLGHSRSCMHKIPPMRKELSQAKCFRKDQRIGNCTFCAPSTLITDSHHPTAPRAEMLSTKEGQRSSRSLESRIRLWRRAPRQTEYII